MTPRTTTTYYCDRCGTGFNTPEDALQCEASEPVGDPTPFIGKRIYSIPYHRSALCRAAKLRGRERGLGHYWVLYCDQPLKDCDHYSSDELPNYIEWFGDQYGQEIRLATEEDER